MEQRVSLITLGVTDMQKSAKFYDALGWKRVESPDGVIAYDMIGQTLGLYSKASLAEELGVAPALIGGFSGVTLGHNVRTREEVPKVLADAVKAGGKLLKAAQEVFWGGYHGYFADPDAHVWEVAYNPFSPLREDGAFCWNGHEET